MSEFTIALAAFHPNATVKQKSIEMQALQKTGHAIERTPRFLEELKRQSFEMRQASEQYLGGRATITEFGKTITAAQQPIAFWKLRDMLERADGLVVANMHCLGRLSLIAVVQLYVAGEMEVPTFLTGRLPGRVDRMTRLDARAALQLSTLPVQPVALNGNYEKMTEQLASRKMIRTHKEQQ